MGDNIEDAKLKDFTTPAARAGWAALSRQADSMSLLAADYGTTCLKLKGGRLLIDRTRNFSEDEFRRTHREYEKFGITDIWVIGSGTVLSPEVLRQYGASFLVMLYPDRKNCMFLIDGVRYGLDGGLSYAMNGAPDSALALPAKAKLTVIPERTHWKARQKAQTVSSQPRAVHSHA